MADQMKHDFYVPVVQQVALNNVPLRNGPSSQNFGEEPMFNFFYIKSDQKCPNKMIACSGGRFWNFIQDLSSGQFYMIIVLANQWLYIIFEKFKKNHTFYTFLKSVTLKWNICTNEIFYIWI